MRQPCWRQIELNRHKMMTRGGEFGRALSRHKTLKLVFLRYGAHKGAAGKLYCTEMRRGFAVVFGGASAVAGEPTYPRTFQLGVGVFRLASNDVTG